jgi:hypothetical protein
MPAPHQTIAISQLASAHAMNNADSYTAKDASRSTPVENGTADMDDVPYEFGDDVCPYCDGDGGDPLNDYVLPCPECGGFNG